ncbi:unnamed protein product [Blumeria hordei]|uniref:F-box domain-containing protein n=1 Tax=Blumeria hordei TaxID=2867405 RepID=A0A383UTQ3_BLUHO|nr:unnamed protein product [Blumeria hordei]
MDMFTEYLDPIKALPFEVVEIIFGLLGMHDLLICLSVSKSWRNLLKSMSSIWTLMIANDEYLPINLKILKTYLSLSNNNINCALVNLRLFKDESIARFLLESCHELQDLRISGEGKFTSFHAASLAIASGIQKLHFSPRTEVTVHTMVSSLEACKNTIVDAKFEHLNSPYTQLKYTWPKLNALTSIHLASRSVCELELPGLIVAAPNIRSFVFYRGRLWGNSRLDMTQWSNLETLDFKNTHVLIFPKLPPSLKHLILDESFSPKHMRRMDEVIYSLPLLETLSLQRNDIEVSTIWEITRSCIQANKLKTLLCGKFGRANSQETPVHEYFPPSSTLEEL